MGKQSRRQRKQLRGKQGPGPSAREVRHVVPAASPPVPSRSDPNPNSAVGTPTKVDWSTWPTSVKLVTVGILLLVVIGLYRRFTEGGLPANITGPDSTGSSSSPGSEAQLPAVSSTAPESH